MTLRLVFQLCPAAAAEAPPQPQRSCDFEGLFGAVPKPAAAAEVPINLFHRVAELVSESLGKLPSSCLALRRRGPGAAVDPTLHAAAPFNNYLFRLVDSLLAKRPINLSFDEAVKVESLVKGLIDSQSMSFWLFSTFLNLSVVKMRFRMETTQSVLLSVRRNDWMVSIDLKDAYLHVPIHPSSRKFLSFTAGGKACQFQVLCFGLSTAPQVFTRVMAPVTAFLHQLGV